MMNTGWICPKCGRVHAPWVASCNCAAPSEYVPYTPPYAPHPYGDDFKIWCGVQGGKLDEGS